MIYLAMFMVSCFFIAIGEKKKQYKVFLFIGLILPVVLAALRKDTIGIDINTYVKPTYTFIEQSSDIKSYLALTQTDFRTRDLELGFRLLSYAAGKLTGGLWGLFAVYEAIMVVAVYNSLTVFNNEISNILYSIKRKTLNENSIIGGFKNSFYRIPIWLGMFCYFSIDYNMSLTMIRQFLACTLVLNAVVHLLAGHWKKALIIWLFGTTMHSSALIAVLILVLYYAVTRRNKWLVYLYIGAVGIFALTGGRMYSIVINFVNRFVHIPARYLSLNYMDFSGRDLNLAWVYNVFIILLIAFLFWKRYKKNSISIFLLSMSITGVSLVPLSVISANAGRILYYYMFMGLIIVPLLYSAIKGKIANPRKASNWIILVYGIIYWLGTTGLNDITGTSEYLFFWQ